MQESDRKRLARTLQSDMPDAYYRFVERVMAEARDAYVRAGEPLGSSDVALAIWFEFGEGARTN